MNPTPTESGRINMAVMTGNPRPRDYPNGVSFNGTDSSERATHPARSSPWGSSIWNNSFAAFARTPDTSALAGATDFTEGKTGSSSLVADSETEWRPTARPAWGDKSTANTTPARSSAVSPVRKRSIVRAQQSQQYVDSTPPGYFQATRGTLSNPVKPFVDSSASNLTSRQVDELNTGFTKFGFGQADVNPVRPDTGITSWPDTGSVHSPSDDRRSVANSEYFAPSSGAPSRSGSLPPSRHGADPAQYKQTLEAFVRLSQQPRQASSFSMTNGRIFPERNGSIQSESFSPIGKPTHEQEHRSSFSHNFAAAYTPGQDMNELLSNPSYLQPSASTEDSAYRNPGTYTPEGYVSAQANQYAQLHSYQIDNSRSTPNGTGVRQSPYYSHMNTPPVYDRLNPYSSEQTLAHPNSVAQLQNKLVGFQMTQQERRVIPPSQLHQQQFQHLYAAAQLQNGYPYQLAMSNGMSGMHLSAIPQHMNMSPMAPMMPVQQQPPRGPREQQLSDGLGVMSIELSNFKREQKSNTKWGLADLKGHIVEFSGDQHGSRFIQQKLIDADGGAKESVFRELEENALQLMQDVFGNYVIQKFFEHGDQIQKKILVGKMKGHVFELSNQMYACRVVQKALEYALTEQQAAMVKELEKDVLKTVKDQNGNHVIQKVIDRVPMQHIQKIVEAFRGNVGMLSVNSYGCRVIQRLLEKVPEPQRRFILNELYAEGPKLITDQYGNYVTQHVIEHGLPEDRAKYVSLIKAQFLLFSKHKFASNVVERCLLFGNDAQRRELVAVVLSKNERGETSVMNLLRDGYGNYVIQKLLDTLNRNDYEMFVQALKPELEKAKKVIPGKQCVSVEKKMYRYDRIDSPTMPTPALSSSAQSPQSSSHPSTNVSTVDEPVNTTSLGGKHSTGGVSIENAAY